MPCQKYNKAGSVNDVRWLVPKVPHSLQIFSHLHLLASLKLPHLPKKLVFPLKFMWPHLNTLEAGQTLDLLLQASFLLSVM